MNLAFLCEQEQSVGQTGSIKLRVLSKHGAPLPSTISIRRYLVTHCEASQASGPENDFCSELTTRYGRNAITTAHCHGHIDINSIGTYRHLIVSPNGCSRQGGPIMEDGASTCADAVVIGTTSIEYSVADRLRLARSLCLAVLRYQATPWLVEPWRYQDFRFFRQDQAPSESLRTLHVGVELQHCRRSVRRIDNSSTVSDGELAVDQLVSQSGKDWSSYGISNIALYCLGVALLQINQQKTLEPEDVGNVRKLAKQSTRMGPRYHKVTQRCLHCDFGVDTDLSQAALQDAVYESVVVELDAMISSFN